MVKVIMNLCITENEFEFLNSENKNKELCLITDKIGGRIYTNGKYYTFRGP